VAVGLGKLVFPAGELEQLEQLVNASFHCGALLAIQGGGKPKKLAPGQLVVNKRTVRNEAQALLGIEWALYYVDPADLYGTAGGLKNSSNHAECGGLTGAVWAQKTK
jgi:hypothetical protein